MAVTIIPYINDFATNPELFDSQAKFVGITENPSEGIQSIPIVYGLRRVEGIRLWTYVLPTNTNILYTVYALSEGWCNRIGKLLIDDTAIDLDYTQIQHRTPVAVTTGPYASILEFEFIDGRSTDIPNTGTVTNVGPSTLILRDTLLSKGYDKLCYLVCKFTYTTPTPYRNLPKVSVDLYGRRIPTFLTGTIALPAYSTNPADIVWDLLSNSTFGGGITTTQIDNTSFSQVKVECNSVNSTSNIKVYEANWIVDTNVPTLENITTILETYGMTLNLIGNKYTLGIESSPTDGQLTFNEDNILSDVSIQIPNFNTLYNKVIVTYPDKDNNYQMRSETYSVSSSLDNNIVLEQRITANSITNYVAANHIAQQILRRSRSQRIYRFRAYKIAHKVRPGDYVFINTTLPLIANRQVIVVAMTMNEDYTFDLECVDYSTAFYAKNFTNVVAPPSTTTQNPPGGGGSNPPPVDPPPDATYTLSSSSSTINEGQSVTFLLNTVSITNGTVVNWELKANVGTILTTEITPNVLTGTLTINSNTAQYTITVANDALTEGDEVWDFIITSTTGVRLASTSVRIQDTSITPPPPKYFWNLAGAPFVDITNTSNTRTSNQDWYMAFTDSNNNYVSAETSTGFTITTFGSKIPLIGSSYANNCVRSRIMRATRSTTLYCTLDIDICLIDRLTATQSVTKNIFCVYDDFSNYQNSIQFYSTIYQKGYLGQILQYNPLNAPTGTNLLKSNLVSASSGTAVAAGYERIDTKGILCPAGSNLPGCVQLRPVTGKSGHYATNVNEAASGLNTIRVPIAVGVNLTNFATINTNAYVAPFQLAGTTTKLLRFYFFEVDPVTFVTKDIGYKVVYLALNRNGITSKYYDVSRTNLTSTIGTTTNPMPL